MVIYNKRSGNKVRYMKLLAIIKLYLNIERRDGCSMSKKGIISIIVVLIVIIAIPIIIKVNSVNKANKVNSEKQRVIDEVTQRVTDVGLRDVVVTIKGTIDEYNLYEILVDCSNMDELSFDEMFAVADAVRDIDYAYVYGYTSNGNSYAIYPSTKSVYRNGEEIYDDYWNSDSHKSAVANENKKEDYNSLSYHTVTDDDTLGEIWAMAQSFVKDNLKSPKSADFPVYGDSKVSITNSGSYYKVTGYVDAENSFGAEVRVTFSLIMEKSGTKYTLKECNIYE